ncbi:MAG: hypothetical protein R3Y36_06790 [Spirochaetales bacterium]
MQTDILGHLIDIEHNAASILFDAQTEADKRIAEARIQASTDYKTQYEKLITEFEKDYHEKINLNEHEHETAVKAFKTEIDKTAKDINSFNSLFETLLFEA